MNDHRAFRVGLLDLKVHVAAAEEGAAYGVALDNGQAVELGAHILKVAFLKVGRRRREHHAVDRPGLHPLHFDHVVQRHLGIGPGQAVHLDSAAAAIVLIGRHDLADGAARADYFHHVADLNAKRFHVGGVEPCQATPDILAQTLADLESWNLFRCFFHVRQPLSLHQKR